MRLPAAPRQLATAALLAVAPCTAARAQWVTGIGEDAIVLPGGMVRAAVGGAFGGFDEGFSSDAHGSPSGGRRPYGADHSFVALDAAALPALADLDAALRSLGGATIPGVTLGPFGVAADARRAELPVRFDVGLGRGVQLFVAGSYVQTRVSVAVAGDPTARLANVGLDPALSDADAAGANAVLQAQLQAAADELQAQLAACGAGDAPACADPAAAAALQAQLAAAAAGIGAAYRTAETPTIGVVPVVGSPLAAAIDGRLAELAAAARAYGVNAVPVDARPRHAPAPLSPGAVQALADTGSAALGLPALRDSRRYGISDVEVGVRVRLLDRLGGRLDVPDSGNGTRLRAALTALVRLPTGEPDDPLDPLDVGVGDGQTDVELGVAADVLRGRRFVGSVAARYGVQIASELERVLPTSRSGPVVATAVERDLGDYLEIEATPRYAVNAYLTLAAHYRFRAKGVDAYAASVGGDPAANDAALTALGLGTDTRQHVLGGGIVFSTLPAHARGAARVPVDVVYQRTATLAGAGRLAERATRDVVTVRVYLTPFGRPPRP